MNDISIDNVGSNNNGMMTSIWGPPGWFFMHTIAQNYPEKITNENKDIMVNYKIFFENIGAVLPCKYCRESYLNYIKIFPIDNFLYSRKLITRWLYTIHNLVNNKLGVPKCNIPTYSSVYNKYESYRAECKQTTVEDRLENLSLGCTTPANGTRKKCLISVIDDI